MSLDFRVVEMGLWLTTAQALVNNLLIRGYSLLLCLAVKRKQASRMMRRGGNRREKGERSHLYAGRRRYIASGGKPKTSPQMHIYTSIYIRCWQRLQRLPGHTRVRMYVRMYGGLRAYPYIVCKQPKKRGRDQQGRLIRSCLVPHFSSFSCSCAPIPMYNRASVDEEEVLC